MPKQPGREKNSYAKRKTDQLNDSAHETIPQLPTKTNFISLLPSCEKLGLGRVSHECGMDLFRDVNLLSRIAPQCMEVLSSTVFSLCGLSGGHSTIHRLCHWTAPDPPNGLR